MNEHCGARAVVWEKLQAGLLAPHFEAVGQELLRARIRDRDVKLGPAIVRRVGGLA